MVGLIVMRDKDMPVVDIVVVEGFLVISFRLAKRLTEE
jgi:hypothetical protein